MSPSGTKKPDLTWQVYRVDIEQIVGRSKAEAPWEGDSQGLYRSSVEE